MPKQNDIAGKSTLTAFWAGVIIALSIAAGGAVTLITRDLDSRLDRAGQQAVVLSKSLAEHTTQTFAMLNALTMAVIEDQEDPIVAAAMLPEVLGRRSAAETAAKGIIILGPDGRVVASSTADPAAGADLSQREAFIALRDLEPSTYITRPYRRKGFSGTRTQRAWAIDFSRRIETADGGFGGAVLIVLDEPAIYSFYKQLDVEAGSVIGMAGEDNIIRASNFWNAIGHDIPSSVSTLVSAGEHINVGSARDTGIEYIFGHSQAAVVPLYTYVGIPTEPLYRAWHHYTALVIAALAALAAALLTVGIILSKYIKSRAELLASSLDAASERHERKFLEAILQTGGALVAVTDRQGSLVVANPAFRTVMNNAAGAGSEGRASLAQILGRPVPELIAALPFQSTINIADSSGRKRELSWSVTGLPGEDGEIRNLVAIGFDNTERREAELAIYQSGKLIPLGDMATGLAHEINHPLGAIGLAVDLLQTRIIANKAGPGFVRDTLALVGRHVDRASAVVSHMRIFGRRSEGVPEPLDPAILVDGALTLAEAQLAYDNVALERNFNHKAHCALAVGVFVEQILLNLLLNARDAILEGRTRGSGTEGGKIAIGISTSDEGDTVEISIEDSGAGLPPEIKERLFDPFFTTKPPGRGTGLGLSLSYGMARQMGGSIKAEDTGSGARFTLILPAGSSRPAVL